MAILWKTLHIRICLGQYYNISSFGCICSNIQWELWREIPVSWVWCYVRVDEFLLFFFLLFFQIVIYCPRILFSSFLLGLCFSLPWNQKNLLGYFAEVIFNIHIANGYLLINGSMLLLFISLCYHHLAFYKMFKHTLQKLNEPNKRGDNEHQLLCGELIRFHNLVKEWVTKMTLFSMRSDFCDYFFVTFFPFSFDFQLVFRIG